MNRTCQHLSETGPVLSLKVGNDEAEKVKENYVHILYIYNLKDLDWWLYFKDNFPYFRV